LYPDNLFTLIFLKNLINKTKKPLSKKTKSAFFRELWYILSSLIVDKPGPEGKTNKPWVFFLEINLTYYFQRFEIQYF